MSILSTIFYDQAVNEKEKISRLYVSKKLKELFGNEGMEPRDIYDKNSDYIKNLGNNPFSGETPINLLAKEWISKLKNTASDAWDPLCIKQLKSPIFVIKHSIYY